MEACTTICFAEERSAGALAEVREGMATLKKQIAQTLLAEMRHRKMRKKEFAKLIGVSFPTFQKLVREPHSQSFGLVNSIFEVLSRTTELYYPEKQLAILGTLDIQQHEKESVTVLSRELC